MPTAALKPKAIIAEWVVTTVCHPAYFACQQAQHASDEAQRRRFDQELKQDIVPGCAERLAESDLPGPLSHGYEHDIHNADSTNDEAHAGNACEQKRKDLRRLLARLGKLLAIHDRKIIVLAGQYPVLLAQHAFDLEHGHRDR